MRSVTAYLGLGSNLEDPAKQIQLALEEIRQLDQTSLITISTLYHSKPLGPPNQPDYLNAVVKIKTTLSPHDLLKACQHIEAKQGRIRTQHWGPRTLDIDILLFGNEKIMTPDLIIPHPEMKNRDFVLIPLREIAPHLIF